MTTKMKAPVPAVIKAKAQRVLTWVQKHMRDYDSSEELFITVFGPHGVARHTFSKEVDWEAFQRTEELKKIYEIVESFPRADTPGRGGPELNSDLTVALRLPKSVHAALLAEAATEGVSLDQLCLSKLVAQLRELV